MRAVERATGKRPAALERSLATPDGIGPCWGWFLELHRTREHGRALRWQEIKAWAELHGRRLSLTEVEVIKALDGGYLAYMVDEARKAAQ
ncbi:MAG: hypothetical protein Q8N51_00910 [Gammaproteobacteria bacterium]|nr:hypothetical protein [Gammaproteobacteria bacterium]